jgi:hypothetical protein
MADFQASFTNATTAEVEVYGEDGVIHATDSSNYATNSEDGHALANFTLYGGDGGLQRVRGLGL